MKLRPVKYNLKLHTIDRPEVAENELTDQKLLMFSFVWLFSFLINQEIILFSCRDRTFLRTCRLQGQEQGLQNVSSRTPSLVDSIEQECEQEMFTELDDINDCIEEKDDADFSTD